MKVDTNTFYVVAYTGGGRSNPTFVKDIGIDAKLYNCKKEGGAR